MTCIIGYIDKKENCVWIGCDSLGSNGYTKSVEIQEDYSVLQPELGFCSVGCGESVAMGSLLTTKDDDLSVPDKIKKALEAAENYCCGVQRPFRIINTKDEEEIVIR